MATGIGDFRAGVVGTDGKHGRIQDSDSRLTTTPDLTCDVDRAILSAKEQYEKIRPRSVAVAVPGTGEYDYPITALTGFVSEFSSILSVVHPYTASQLYRLALQPGEFDLVPLSSGTVLRLAYAPTGVDFLVTFTAPHTLTVATSTIPASDDQALMDLAAANCCDMLAALYAKDTDSSIGADSVDRAGKSENYRSMAASYRRSWEAKMLLFTRSGMPRVRDLLRA